MKIIPSQARPASGAPGVESPRLHGLDALRCVAALMVMMFHYTTRYEQKFGHSTAPEFNFAWGYLGVNLFFMISGFVIFMTLERSARPKDFLLSRFSRLYPAYWVAAIMTFGTMTLLPELGKTVTIPQAIGNVLMFHGLLGVPNIDGVYWTLEVELLFYWAMLLIWLTGGLASSWRWIGPWLALSMVAGLVKFFGFGFPYVVSRLLILPYFPYFALGCILYVYFVKGGFRWSVEGILGIFALVTIGINDSPTLAIWTMAFLALFRFVLRQGGSTRAILFLAKIGIFSYPIYLVHETIGWTVIHLLEARDVSANIAIIVACAIALVLAYLLHIAVEQPAMSAIRRLKSSTQKATFVLDAATRTKWLVATLLVGVAVLVGNRLTL